MIDNALVHRNTQQEHDQRLVWPSWMDHVKSVTLNKEKCEFFKHSIT